MRFSIEQKRKAVELSHEMSLPEAASKVGCSLASLMNWRREARDWVDPSKIKRAGAVVDKNGGLDEIVKLPNKEVIILQYLVTQLQQITKTLNDLIIS